MLGGKLVPLFKALFGPDTLLAAASRDYDLAIMGIGTVHADHGFMDRGEDEAELRRVVRGRAKRSVMLADSSKFGRLGQITTFALTDVSVLVTDAAPKGAFAERLDGSRVQVIVA